MLSLRGVARYLFRHKVDLLCVAVVVVVAAEIYLRLPFGWQMEYQPDPELVGVLRPGQTSFRETINSDGHRGRETDWTKPTLVAVGDSQGWGTGLPDESVWTSRLEGLLKRRLALPEVQVVNASHPGHGPYHQYIRLKRVMEKRRPGAILVRVSIEDRNFHPPAEKDLPRLTAEVESRQRVRAWTKFGPFLVRKVIGEGPLLRYGQPSAGQGTTARSEESGTSMWTRHEKWWRKMVELAGRTGTPLVFVVHDPTELPSNAVLARNLDNLAAKFRGVHVLRLGPGHWNLAAAEPKQRAHEYRLRYTLQYDMHGNEAHHEVVARSVFSYLKSKDLMGSPQRVSSR